MQKYRMALLSNTTFEFLVKYISDNRKSLMNSEYLFTKLTGKNKGEPLDADSVYSMLKRLSKKRISIPIRISSDTILRRKEEKKDGI